MDIPDTDNDGIEQNMDIDKDNDGLIEICDLEGLNEIRFQLDGSGYTTGTSAMGAMKITTGCRNDRCTGYELTRDLDFMADGNYRSGSVNTAWTTNPTWDPIGTDAANERFNATFNGNSHTISNLRINRTGTNNVGLFGATGGSARITNLGLLDVDVTGQDEVGGLVGESNGNITNSYVTGVTGSVRGRSQVGGLTGRNNSDIRNSYVTAPVLGSDEDVGGLVGFNNARITNSYATGHVSGRKDVGGLAGFSANISVIIRNSYATGRVSGSSGQGVGGLVGDNANPNRIVNSYWLRGSSSNVGTRVPAGTLQTMTQLQSPTTNEGIYRNWSTGDWDFGSSIQYPILKASGSDALLPNQGTGLRNLRISAVGAELIPAFDGETTRHTLTILPGTSEIDLTLIAYNPDPATTIALVEQGESTDLFDGMGSGDSVSVDVTEPPPVLIITVSEPGLEEPSVYRVEVTALPLCTLSLSMNIPDDGDGVRQVIDVDKDNDGLIEICDLEGLDAMRYVLNGSGYKADATATTNTTGCPSGGCNGYELTKSLDFMADDSYRDTANKATWTVANYDDSSDTGWEPIGRGFPDVFAARFDGNGYTISNLMINRSGSDDIGLFGETTSSRIANLGLLDVDIIGQDFVGGLVGENFSRITNSYVTGEVRGSSVVGGLVGKNEGNRITNSYATASVTGTGNNVGGLVGRNVGTAFIMNSYATGRVEGSGSSSNVGGLVGMNESLGSITNSYATGEVTGSGATVGGLVGFNDGGTITSSYWLSRPELSSGMGDTTSTPTAAIVLTSPTSPTDIYMGWDANAWDFGSPFEYPALKYATDCVNRDENTVKPVAGQPTCDTLLGDDQKVELELPIPSCTLSLIDTYTEETDDGVPQFMDVDKDNDGLIEICDLEGLDEIRYQLDGRGYRAGADADVVDDGCATTCTGFELTKNLDFNDPTSYRPDSTNQTAWTSRAGWNPIRRSSPFFSAIFDGNGHTISNLMINRGFSGNIGLFGATASNAEITNLGLLDVNIQARSTVGGLAGQNRGDITNSYVMGIISGSRNSIGGLVGWNTAGSITNSYAMVSVSGSRFNTGGLVGQNTAGRIENSYVTGSVSVTGSDIRSIGNIGGLVGWNNNAAGMISMIRNSYATGEVKAEVTGSVVTIATIGGLVGSSDIASMIEASYWLRGSASMGGLNVASNTGKTTMELQEPTTATGIYSNWRTDDWDFGTSLQFPILKYPDGNLIPNQGIGLRSLQTSTTAAQLIPPLGGTTTRHAIAVPPGTSSIDLTLTAYNSTAMIEVVTEGDDNDYFDGKGSRDSVSVPIATNPVLIITVREPDLEEPIVYRVVVTTLPPCTVSLNTDDDNDGIEQVLDIDKDGDGLIEICDLEGLDEMRHQLDGTGYKTTSNATIITKGCGGSDCTGYELTKSLDFMADNNYRTTANKVTWTTGEGWQPIGTSSEVFFSATFEGNGYTISNLMIDRSGENNIGLFGGARGKISNIGLRNVDISGLDDVGGLVGSNSTTITNSYVTGSVSGRSQVGGLVGSNSATITNSYATASVEGSGENVGGLVGRNSATITNSYAIGSVLGSATNRGGLVGNNTGSITNSYATGRVGGSSATVGGLVGNNTGGMITISYWLSGSASSGGTNVPASTLRTAMALISPTAPNMMIYTGWSTDDWDFGTNEQFPALRYSTDCIDPEITTIKSDTGQPICGTVLLNQQVELQSQFLPPCTGDLIGDDIYTETMDDGVPPGDGCRQRRRWLDRDLRFGGAF